MSILYYNNVRLADTTAKILKELIRLSEKPARVVALEMGLNEDLLYVYVNGRSVPGGELLIKFADYFGVTTDYLLGRVEI